MEKILGSSKDSNPRPSEYQSDALTTEPLGPLAVKEVEDKLHKQHCLA